MKNKRSSLLLMLIVTCFHGERLLAVEKNDIQAAFDGLVEFACGEIEYVQCIQLSENGCADAIRKAMENCPLRYMESVDLDVMDGSCVTKKFFEIAEIPDKLAISCDELLKPKLEALREEQNMYMPNNAAQRDAGKPGRWP